MRNCNENNEERTKMNNRYGHNILTHVPPHIYFTINYDEKKKNNQKTS